MNSYRYRVTVEQVADAGGQPRVANGLGEGRSVAFLAACHDDLLGIVDRVRARGMMDVDAAAAMTVGMKLLGEVVLAERKDPMFADLHAALGRFFRQLKAQMS